MRKGRFILNKWYVDPASYNLKHLKLGKLQSFEFNKEESVFIIMHFR